MRLGGEEVDMTYQDSHSKYCDTDKDQQLGDFYQHVLDQALRCISSADAGSILVLQGGHYHFVAARGFNLPGLQTITLRLDELLLSPYDARPSYILHDFDKYNFEHLDDQRLKTLAIAGRVHEIYESMALPVREQDIITMVLCLDILKQGRAFSQDEIEKAEMVADVLGLALRCDNKLSKVHILNTLFTESQDTQNIPPMLLTARHQQLLRLIGSGLSDKEIAKQLNVAHCTARNQVTELLGKLGVKNRTQAAMWAVKYGLLDLVTEL
jgi:DNA-binding CsgD family transcriptional regulator